MSGDDILELRESVAEPDPNFKTSLAGRSLEQSEPRSAKEVFFVNNGWVKLHRKITDWEWYTDHAVFRVFTHLLLTANHEEKKWRGQTIKSGQKITSLSHLAEETGLSVRSVRTALEKLQTTGELTSQTTNRFTLISIDKWRDYQIKNDTPQDKPLDTHSDKQTTTNKNEKKLRSKELNTGTPGRAGFSESKHNPLGAEIINALIPIDPKNKKYYGNTTQRSACDFLLEEYGLEEILKRVSFLPTSNKLPYFPTITTPVQLRDKWVQLQDAVDRKRLEAKDKKPLVV